MAVLTVHSCVQFRIVKDYETLPSVQQITKLKLTGKCMHITAEMNSYSESVTDRWKEDVYM